MYTHGQGVGNGIPQEPTNEKGERDPVASKCNEDIYHSLDASDGDESNGDECLDQAVDNDSHEESESESVQSSTNDDIKDYDALDYQH